MGRGRKWISKWRGNQFTTKGEPCVKHQHRLKCRNLLLFGLLWCSAWGQQKKIGSKNGKAEHTQVTEADRSIVINIPNVQRSVQEVADEKARTDEDMSVRKSNLRLTWAIAIAAVVQAGAVVWQIFIYKHQSSLMKDGLVVAGKSANAARESANAFMKSARPLLIIDWENVIWVHPENPNGVLSHTFNWGMRNVGTSVAFVTESAVRFVLIESTNSLPREPLYNPPRSFTGEPILPTGPSPAKQSFTHFERLEDSRNYDVVEDIVRSQKMLLYAYGYVMYKDIYGKKHKTHFGLAYHAEEAMSMQYDGFYMAGPKTYNQYT